MVVAQFGTISTVYYKIIHLTRVVGVAYVEPSTVKAAYTKGGGLGL
ncbi:MAG: hypothetical protein WBV55_16595 [Candidatus Sulfotelmatobacter sp.]